MLPLSPLRSSNRSRRAPRLLAGPRRHLGARLDDPDHVLARPARVLAAVDGVGATAVPAQLARLLPLQGHLVHQTAALDLPRRDAADAAGHRVAIDQPI